MLLLVFALVFTGDYLLWPCSYLNDRERQCWDNRIHIAVQAIFLVLAILAMVFIFEEVLFLVCWAFIGIPGYAMFKLFTYNARDKEYKGFAETAFTAAAVLLVIIALIPLMLLGPMGYTFRLNAYDEGIEEGKRVIQKKNEYRDDW